jgi:hypothetical protein
MSTNTFQASLKQTQYSYGGFGGGRQETQPAATSSSVEEEFRNRPVGGGSGGGRMGGFRFTAESDLRLGAHGEVSNNGRFAKLTTPRTGIGKEEDIVTKQ